MNPSDATAIAETSRPSIAILGVPFDNVTKAEAIDLIERMIASGKPHYLVTPNVDFLVQARRDIELRRILFEAHLVLCDGTPLVWASRFLGNPLPERVAGADLVPLLIQVAARKKYRLFLLGATPGSAARAVSRLQQEHPGLVIAGHYSPPFHPLLEMDHEEITRRVQSARPDLLLVSFGCPKQEKWVAMHYRRLGVPVTAGVGATIDFLAGEVKRAPRWMQRSGTEWVFRLAQEPRRLFRRYFTDLWVFGASILPQWWRLQARAGGPRSRAAGLLCAAPQAAASAGWSRAQLPDRLDFAAVASQGSLIEELVRRQQDCLMEMGNTQFIDSTGMGLLIRLQKRLRACGRHLVLLGPSAAVLRALALMRLTEFFQIASSETAAVELLQRLNEEALLTAGLAPIGATPLRWSGEITAANAEAVWEHTRQYLNLNLTNPQKTIDLSGVRFMDSTGLGLMVRARKLSLACEEELSFVGLQPAVRDVVRLARLEEYLLGARSPKHGLRAMAPR